MRILTLVLVLLWYASCSAQSQLLFIDTQNNPAYAYHNTLTMLKALGYHVTYQQAYDLELSTLDRYPAIFITLDPTFLAVTSSELTGKKNDNAYVNLLMNLLHTLKNLRNKHIGIIIPAINNYSDSVKAALDYIFNQMGIMPRDDDSNKQTLNLFLQLLLSSDAQKGHGYDRSLLHKEPASLLPIKKLQRQLILHIKSCTASANITKAKLLPFTSPYHNHLQPLQPFYPHGLYFYNPHNNNHLLITKESYLTFADASENFFMNPLQVDLRAALLTGIYEMLQQFFYPQKKLQPLPTAINPHTIASHHLHDYRKKIKLTPHHEWIKKNRLVCGWLEICSFHKAGIASIDTILQSGLNLLWLDLNPEWYLAHNGIKSDEKEDFFEMISWFTKNLKERATALNKPLPHLFLGTQLTPNFKTQPVTVSAVDMFGINYSKVPSPFDITHFWQPQVFDSLDACIDRWQTIGNGLPLEGIFFDFEMYHAQDQLAHFTHFMDFSDPAWQLYVAYKHNPALKKYSRPEERISYLITHKLCHEYFHCLAQEAYKLGIMIKNHFKKRLPKAQFAAYDVFLPNGWFYINLYAGLSTPQEPLILVTFNNEFKQHLNWLTSQNLHVYHMSVLLLSKLRCPQDFSLIQQVLKHNDGIWFNRFSRLVEEPPVPGEKCWYRAETSPLPPHTIIKNISQQITR